MSTSNVELIWLWAPGQKITNIAKKKFKYFYDEICAYYNDAQESIQEVWSELGHNYYFYYNLPDISKVFWPAEE